MAFIDSECKKTNRGILIVQCRSELIYRYDMTKLIDTFKDFPLSSRSYFPNEDEYFSLFAIGASM